ncbi:hypothetical protein J4G08_20625 [Candidatus Poribacteria bacterium]|nr:hypothetical protein [Candidatus Poribacteria bacterium]
MAKKPSLTEALNSAGKTAEQSAKSATQEKTKSEKSGERKSGSSRAGKKLIAGHFDPDVHRQLKQLSVNANTSIQDLLAEALNDLFQKHGLPR